MTERNNEFTVSPHILRIEQEMDELFSLGRPIFSIKTDKAPENLVDLYKIVNDSRGPNEYISSSIDGFVQLIQNSSDPESIIKLLPFVEGELYLFLPE